MTKLLRTKVVSLDAFGGPEVLRLREVHDAPPAAGEIRIRQTAIGVNFTDVHGRRGDYADLHAAPKPLVLGMEAAGVVDALGAGVSGFKSGDRVAYASRPLGAYRTHRNFPAERCVALPAGIADEIVAAVLLKGLTLQMLLRRVFRVERGMTVVVHSAAGGVGLLAGQWLRALGAIAIGIVGSDEKAQAARQNGYAHAFVLGRDDWPARVHELTGGAGVPVVYDPVGLVTWEGSLACLAPRGHLVCYGNSSGLVPPFQINGLRDRGSLRLSWVRFSDYTADAAELQAAAQEVFAALADGTLRPAPPRVLPLAQAAEAHQLLESRQTSGALVLVP